MAKSKVRNGQAEYGTIHLMEEEMREAEQGVFAKSSTAPSTKSLTAAPENKAKKAAPAKKAAAKRKRK